MAKPPDRRALKAGLKVEIETKRDQKSGRLTSGVVRDILTASKSHPYGIKVRLEDGQVGRVKKIVGALPE